jgi:predicted RNase H-like HicB family nuclease
MPRKKLAEPVTLKVVFEPDEGGWHVYVSSLQGCRTWGRSLSEARRNIREAISLFEEDFDDADAVARDAVLDEDIRLPGKARALLEQAEAAQARAQAAAAQAKSATVAVAHQLTAAKVSLRDAGEILHLSQEGVRKLVQTPLETVLAVEDIAAPSRRPSARRGTATASSAPVPARSRRRSSRSANGRR